MGKTGRHADLRKNKKQLKEIKNSKKTLIFLKKIIKNKKSKKKKTYESTHIPNPLSLCGLNRSN